MSYENREDDKKAILALKEGEKYYFNMFQDGGAVIKKTKTAEYTLYGIPLYGGEEGFCGSFCDNEIDDILNEVYDIWI